TFTIHYLDYQKFRAQWQNMQAQGPIDWRQVPKAEREHMRRFAQVTNFMEYLDARAHEGVELKRGGGQGKGFNLGYVGTYLYWHAEIGLVAGLIIAMTRKPTRDPFCTITQAWKTERCGDNFAVPEPVGIEAVAHAVQEGAVGKLADLKLAAREAGVPTIPIRMYVYASPQHSDFTPVEVVLNQFFTNKNGQQEEIELLKGTYPPQALAALEQLCRL
ncbi:MAG TPA: hypothetical protein PKD72_09315, partial [Gemmatales bacterium]|nr:hypothetical protein [Gemmatales bacterium]